AKVEIDWVGDEISRGRVIEQNDENAVVGAKVKLYKMHAADYVPVEAGVESVTPVSSGSSTGSSSNSSSSGGTSNPAKPGRG
ncbi:MAG: hypothetical protein AAGB31_07475, partial [Bdellovibrio sp.]